MPSIRALRPVRRSSILPSRAIFAASLAFAGCSGGDDAPDGAPAGATGSALADSIRTAPAPAAARPVADVVATTDSGAELVAVGRVGEAGSDAAYFTLVDASVKSCVDMMDECKTPWDYCCVDRAELRRASATVELRDAGGKLRAGSLIGVGGLDHLATVAVKGRVEKDSAGNVTIVADEILVQE